MKVKHLLALTIVTAGLATLIAHAGTPQEDIKYYTSSISQNAKYGVNTVATDYAERAIAYSKAGQWQNSLNDSAWLKQNKIYTWSSYRGLAEARTKAYLGLGRTDEAVQDMYETFLAGAHSSDLRRLKDFIAKNPQYSNYLDLNARASMIQQYATSEYAKEMWTSANYNNGIRDTENSLYMLQVAEKMLGNMNNSQKYQFYDTYHTVLNNRYETCKWHSDDPTYNVSDQTKNDFIANGSIACSAVMSQQGLEEGLRVAETAAKIFMHNSGNTSYTSAWKQAIKNWNDRLGRTSTPERVSTPANVRNYNSSYSTTTTPSQTNYNSTPAGNVLNSVQSGIQSTDNMIKGVNSIRSGLKGLGF